MATFSPTRQPEMEVEDVNMNDATIVSSGGPLIENVDSLFDPMDISPAPARIQTSRTSQMLGFATERNPAPPLGFSTLQPTQSKAPFGTTHKFSSSFGPQTRPPFVRSPLRFSPKSRPHLPPPGPIYSRVSHLHRKPNPFTTLTHYGLRNHNYNAKPLFNTRTQNETSVPTTRDSSFSSIETQKSTEDGKVQSFDSSTSVSTTQSFQSRKRLIDEGSNDVSDYAVLDTEKHIPLKYRRVSEEGVALASGESKEASCTMTTDPNESSGQTEARSPLVQLKALPTPPFASIGAPANTPDQTLTFNNVPGGWPSTPYGQDVEVPYSTNNGEHPQTGPAMMSGALPPPPSASFPAPELSDQGLKAVDISDSQPENATLTSTDQPSNTLSGSYWASWYDSVQAVYSIHNGVKQTFASAVKYAAAFADSCRQRALGLFGRDRPPAARLSPTRRSPTRANLRALPEEQQRRVKEHQWRKDRGYPTVENYPFPSLSFHHSTSSLAAQVELNCGAENNDMHKMHGVCPQQPNRHANRLRVSTNRSMSSSAKGVRRKEARSGIRKVSRVDPVSPQLKRRMFMRARVRDPERARRELALLQVIRYGKIGALDDNITKNNTATHPQPTELPSYVGHTNPADVQTQPELVLKPKLRVRFQDPLVTESAHKPQPFVPELAPHLHPSSPKIHRDNIYEDISIEQKENIPPAPSVVEVEPPVIHTEVPEPPVDPWLQPTEFPLGRPVSAVSLFYPVPQPLPPGRIESIYADQWREIEEEEKRKQRPVRVRPEGPAVRPLPPKWEARVSEAMSMPNNRKIATTLSGDPLTKKDLATCFTRMAWLNDEVINSYLALIIDYLRRSHGNAGRHDKPRFHAFNSFFFSNLRDKGYDSVRRWATRAKIGGEALLNVDTVFVPVHNSAHWTLIVVKPADRTIENFDSLGSLSRRHVGVVKTWLRGELGARYVEEDWTVLPSVSPQQDNGSDCGVFLLSTAKAVAIDLEPLSYGAKDTLLLRKKIVAELMNGGLEGDFNPVGERGEVLL